MTWDILYLKNMKTLLRLIFFLATLSANNIYATKDLKFLIHQDCGSCHGLQLKGGLGPALNKDVMKTKSDQFLFLTIKEGRPGTAMPPWKSLLNDEEINKIVQYLKEGFE